VTDAIDDCGRAHFFITVICVECGETLEVPENRVLSPRPITCGGCPIIEPIEERDGRCRP
jgi:formylmethanofuran dehydrogenase subunit E